MKIKSYYYDPDKDINYPEKDINDVYSASSLFVARTFLSPATSNDETETIDSDYRSGIPAIDFNYDDYKNY